jgi:hypothetical protein
MKKSIVRRIITVQLVPEGKETWVSLWLISYIYLISLYPARLWGLLLFE